MLSYCLREKNTENINPVNSKTSNGKTMILSKCAICGAKNQNLLKNVEEHGILSSLGLKTPLSKIPFYDDVLF